MSHLNRKAVLLYVTLTLMQITERKSLFSRRFSWSEQNSCCVWSNSPVHLDCSLVFLTKLILILMQFFQCHVLICFDCMDKKNVLKMKFQKLKRVCVQKYLLILPHVCTCDIETVFFLMLNKVTNTTGSSLTDRLLL